MHFGPPGACSLLMPSPQSGCSTTTACYLSLDQTTTECLAPGATPVGHGCTSPGDCAPGELCSFPSLATIGTCLLLCDPLATNYPCGFDRVSQFPLGCTAAGGTENYGICPDNGYAVVDAGPG
jgi:hypothetical protein